MTFHRKSAWFSTPGCLAAGVLVMAASCLADKTGAWPDTTRAPADVSRPFRICMDSLRGRGVVLTPGVRADTTVQDQGGGRFGVAVAQGSCLIFQDDAWGIKVTPAHHTKDAADLKLPASEEVHP